MTDNEWGLFGFDHMYHTSIAFGLSIPCFPTIFGWSRACDIYKTGYTDRLLVVQIPAVKTLHAHWGHNK